MDQRLERRRRPRVQLAQVTRDKDRSGDEQNALVALTGTRCEYSIHRELTMGHEA